MATERNEGYLIYAPEPVDARTVIQTPDELGVVPLPYEHMRVHVISEDADYQYYTNPSRWVKISATGYAVWSQIQGDPSSSVSLVGYLNQNYLPVGWEPPLRPPMPHTHPTSDIEKTNGTYLFGASITATNFILRASTTSTEAEDLPLYGVEGGTSEEVVNINYGSTIVYRNSIVTVEDGVTYVEYIESDPTVPSYIKAVTEEDIAKWNEDKGPQWAISVNTQGTQIIQANDVLNFIGVGATTVTRNSTDITITSENTIYDDSTLQGSVNQLQNDVSDINTSIGAINSDITGLDNRLGTAESDINALETQLGGASLNDSGSGSLDIWSAYKVQSQISSIVSGISWQNPVKTIGSQPSSPPEGYRFINSSTKNIGTYSGGSWDYITPLEGWATYVDDQDSSYVFNEAGEWVEALPSIQEHNSLLGLNVGDYQHLTQTQLGLVNSAVQPGDNVSFGSGYFSGAITAKNFILIASESSTEGSGGNTNGLMESFAVQVNGSTVRTIQDGEPLKFQAGLNTTVGYNSNGIYIDVASIGGGGDVQSSRTLTAGTGLLGGGDLSADRSFSLAPSYSPSTATSIPGSQNLNDYQTAGFYYQSANAGASSGSNYPESKAGSLVVQKAAGVTQQYYVYNDNSPDVYFRGFYNGAWSSWRRIINTSNYTNFTVTKTGSGANGTWGINITGSAGSAATASTAATASEVTVNTSSSNSIYNLVWHNNNVLYSGNNKVRMNPNTGELFATGNIYCGGNLAINSSLSTSSDRRLKKNIETIPNALSIVEKLRGTSFDWKSDGQRDLGVIAQELEEVIPELVKDYTLLHDEHKTKTVNYSGIIPVLIEAIKELSYKVKSLENG